jgi:hypothetical protein
MNSLVTTTLSLAAVAFMVCSPFASADDPTDCDQLPPDQAQQCKLKQGKQITDEILDNAGRAPNGQRPGNQPGRNQLIGGAWMTVNGVLTCVPNGAVFSHNERVESARPPNGDPRC